MKRLLLYSLFSIAPATAFAQIGIGTETPHKSAILDIKSPNSGVLIPRVTLTSGTDRASIANGNPANGLLVYNTGADANFAGSGFYYWNGGANGEWVRFNESTSAQPSVIDLQCSNASLSPAKYVGGSSFYGKLTVPYSGGNGGYYASGGALTPSPANGTLTYTLQADKLANGSGNLVYIVSGTPTTTSPTTTTFKIDFGGKSCETKQGTGNIIEPTKYARKTVPINADTPDQSVLTLDNLLVRFNIKNANAEVGFLEIATTTQQHVTWIYHKAGRGQANIETYGQMTPGPTTWTRLVKTNATGENLLGENLNAFYRDVATLQITLHENNEVYRVVVNTNGDIPSAGQVAAVTPKVTLFIEKFGDKNDKLTQ